MKKVLVIIMFTVLLMPVLAQTADIIFFFTPGCEHCAQVEEWLEELKVEYGDNITIRNVDVTFKEGWDEFKSYDLSVTPAIIIINTKGDKIILEFQDLFEESLGDALDKALKGEVYTPTSHMGLGVLIIGIISGTTACVLAVAAFMFAMVTSSGSKFKQLLLIALSFGLGLIFVFMVLATLLAVGSYSLAGGGASMIRFYVSLILGYFVLVLGLNQFNYAFEFVKMPVSTKRFFERLLEGLLSKRGYIGAFLFGILFAPVKLPCALPALGIIMEDILVRGDLVRGLFLAAVYGVGVLIPLVVVAVISGGSAQFASKLRWSDTYRKVSWGIGGIVVLVVAIWIFWSAFEIPEPVTQEHYIAFLLLGVATFFIMVLFIKYGKVITESKLWKRTSRKLQKIFR
ncbi:MAG: glutaredoxin family protein [Theionarchaea archaeon]|nr:glutaredoxin family protein [Theionarchaea archaeon]